MSKGSPRVTVRIDKEILDRVNLALLQRNARSPDEPWIFADFVRIALTEKLDKIARGRGKRGGVRHPPPRRVN